MVVLNVKVLIVLLLLARVTRQPLQVVRLLPSGSAGWGWQSWDVNPASAQGESPALSGFPPGPHTSGEGDSSRCRPGPSGPAGNGGAVVPPPFSLTARGSGHQDKALTHQLVDFQGAPLLYLGFVWVEDML